MDVPGLYCSSPSVQPSRSILFFLKFTRLLLPLSLISTKILYFSNAYFNNGFTDKSIRQIYDRALRRKLLLMPPKLPMLTTTGTYVHTLNIYMYIYYTYFNLRLCCDTIHISFFFLTNTFSLCVFSLMLFF